MGRNRPPMEDVIFRIFVSHLVQDLVSFSVALVWRSRSPRACFVAWVLRRMLSVLLSVVLVKRPMASRAWFVARVEAFRTRRDSVRATLESSCAPVRSLVAFSWAFAALAASRRASVLLRVGERLSRTASVLAWRSRVLRARDLPSSSRASP